LGVAFKYMTENEVVCVWRYLFYPWRHSLQ